MTRQRFELRAPGAERAFIAGDFNDWDTTSLRMRKMPKQDGLFVRILDLPEGRHEFKYIVDGEWRCCPHAPQSTSTLGTVNSCIEVNGSR